MNKQIMTLSLITAIGISLAGCSNSAKVQDSNYSADSTATVNENDGKESAVVAELPSYPLSQEAFFYDSGYVDIDPYTEMRKYTITLPQGLSDAQIAALLPHVVEMMPISPSDINEHSELAPMPQDMIAKYKKLYDSNSLSINNAYEITEVTPVEDAAPGLVVMQIADNSYSGGPHGAASISYLNWDIAKQQPVTLAEYIQTPPQKEALKALLYDKAKQKYGTSLFAGKADFPIATAYKMGKEGITFVYQQYEIGPNSIGLPEITVTYDEIKALK